MLFRSVAGLGGAGLPPGATVYTGPVVSTRFGPVQVQIAALNGSIVEVVATELPVGGRSGSISRYAGPILQREAMAAGTAAIDFVSGATYTSRAYQQSLQAAIDKLRA